MIVIKAGGGEGIHYESVCDEVAELHRGGQPLILVHGGSHLTNQLAMALEHPPRFVTSPTGFTSRFTDRRTMDIFMMAYCGFSNKTIVEGLQRRSINALGLSGIDGRIWTGLQKAAIRIVENGRQQILRGNLTGTVESVNCSLLNQLLDAGLLPVITPPAMTREGLAINVDGDRAAAITAAQMGAAQLVILSNVPGVLRDIGQPDSLIREIRRDQLDSVLAEFAQGRMKIKLLAAGSAIDAGLQRVIIADARAGNCVSAALAGQGTVIVP